MPTIIARPSRPAWMPEWAGNLRDQASLNPVGEMAIPDQLESLGKPISELLGTLFTTPTKTGLPAKLRLTNWDAKSGEAVMHGVRKAGEELRATPHQLDTLIGADNVNIQQPAESAVARIQALLHKMLQGQ